MQKWTGGYFYTKNVQFENVSFFIKVSGEETFLLFQHGEIAAKSAMLFYWYAWCKNVDNIDPNLAIEICKWSVTITICSFPYIWKSKLDYVNKSAHEVISGSNHPLQYWANQYGQYDLFTATMEMGTFHLRGAIELSILDQFWQMRCQNYCDLISFFMLFSNLNNDQYF